MSENITTNHSLAKSRISWLHFYRRQYGYNINRCDVFGPIRTDFSKIMQNNRHYTVQRHSKSPVLVTVESPYATSYV